MTRIETVSIPNRPTLTAPEVADIFNVTVKTIYNWLNGGKLTGIKRIGKPVRFKRESIVALLEETE